MLGITVRLSVSEYDKKGSLDEHHFTHYKKESNAMRSDKPPIGDMTSIPTFPGVIG